MSETLVTIEDFREACNAYMKDVETLEQIIRILWDDNPFEFHWEDEILYHPELAQRLHGIVD